MHAYKHSIIINKAFFMKLLFLLVAALVKSTPDYRKGNISVPV